MPSSIVAGHVRPTNWLGNCHGVPPLSYPRRGRVTDENLCVFEKVFGGETAYIYGFARVMFTAATHPCAGRVPSWRNNFLRRRTWRLRHDTLVRRRVSQRLVFATSRLRQALVRQGPAMWCFGISFVVNLNKMLGKWLICHVMSWSDLWCHNAHEISLYCMTHTAVKRQTWQWQRYCGVADIPTVLDYT